MRFALYHAFHWFGLKVNWDPPEDITDEVRAALHPQEAEHLRFGVLRKRFVYEPSENGRRSRHVRAAQTPAVHAKGALVFAPLDDAYILIEIEEEPP